MLTSRTNWSLPPPEPVYSSGVWASIQEFLNEHQWIAAGILIGTLNVLVWILYRRLKAIERLVIEADLPLRELQRWGGNIDERLSDIEEGIDSENTDLKERLKRVEDIAYQPRIVLNKEGMLEQVTPRREGETVTLQTSQVRTAWDRLREDD